VRNKLALTAFSARILILVPFRSDSDIEDGPVHLVDSSLKLFTFQLPKNIKSQSCINNPENVFDRAPDERKCKCTESRCASSLSARKLYPRRVLEVWPRSPSVRQRTRISNNSSEVIIKVCCSRGGGCTRGPPASGHTGTVLLWGPPGTRRLPPPTSDTRQRRFLAQANLRSSCSYTRTDPPTPKSTPGELHDSREF
jgi:hypothetical protein